MSSNHAQHYRPIVYRTATPWWLRAWRALRAWLLATVLLVLLAFGAATLIVRLQVTDAQLDRVHAQGVSVGMTMCAGR